MVFSPLLLVVFYIVYQLGADFLMLSKLVESMLFLNEQSVMVLLHVFMILKEGLNMIISKCLITCRAKIIVSIAFYRLQE
jgi:hypothetical protein